MAKPVIDIMAGVESLDISRPAIPVLSKVGYCYFEYRPDVMHGFCKPSPAFRTHHLHLVPYRSPLWNERLAFRDYLREHAETAAEYVRLKQELADLHRFDREAYTDGKTSFVERIINLGLPARLEFEPLMRTHAAVLHPVLQDERIYRFISQDPPTLEALENRYARLESRTSPDGSEKC